MSPRHLPSPAAPVIRALRVTALAAAAAFAGTAQAQGFSVGVGAGTDRGRVDCVASFACDRTSNHWKLTGGYRLGDAVDVQAIWFDAGRFKGGDTTPLGTDFGGTFKASGVGLSAGYRWDVASNWSVHARAGAAVVRTRFDYENAAYGSAGKTTLQPLVGIGIAYALTPALRIGIDDDVTRFRVHTRRGTLQMLGVGLQYSF